MRAAIAMLCGITSLSSLLHIFPITSTPTIEKTPSFTVIQDTNTLETKEKILCGETFENVTLIDNRVSFDKNGEQVSIPLTDCILTDPIVFEPEKYSYTQLQEDIISLCVRYPQLSFEALTQTSDGRTIYALQVGNPNGKHVLIQAGIHGREYANPYLCMRELETLLACIDHGSYHGVSYKDLLDSVCLHIIPMMNPDGISISQFGEAGMLKEETKQRIRQIYQLDKAANKDDARYSYEKYLTLWKANANGVDLNRNFPLGWGHHDVRKTYSSSHFLGTAPASEAETKALINYTLKYQPVAVISYHSMGEMMFTDTPGHKQVYQKDFVSLYQQLTGYWIPAPGPANGGYLDWLLLQEFPTVTVTLETGNKGCPFLNRDMFDRMYKQNVECLVALLYFAYTH